MVGKRFATWFGALVLTVSMLSGCGSGKSADQAANPAPAPAGSSAPAPGQVKKELRIAMQYDIGTLDPGVLSSVTDKQMSSNLYDGLVRYKLGTVTIEPDLAEKWEMTPDGLQWTFHLRKGVQFHRTYGEFKASDVKFTFDRLKDPALKSAPGKLLAAVKSVDVVDDYTVKFTLANPDPAFLDKLANSVGFIVSEKAVKEKADKYGQNPIGTGPYMFDKWTPQQETDYIANPSYWGNKPGLDKVIYLPIPDPTTMYNAFEAGDVDLLQVTDPDKLAKYKADKNIVIDQKPGLITRFFGMNDKVKPFDNKQVRQAVMFAVDRDSILNNVFKGMSTPASGILAPDVENAMTGIFQPKYDPAQAKALLAQAGFPQGFSTTMYLPNVDRFTKPAQVVQENLKAVGITVDLKVMETQQFLAELQKGGLPMFMLSRGQDATPDRVLSTWFSTKGIPVDNWANISIPQVDGWITTATSTLDTAKRKDAFNNVQKAIVDEANYYYLDHENQIFAIKATFKGFVGDPQRSIRLDNVTVAGGK